MQFTIQHLKKGGIVLTPEPSPSSDSHHHANKMLQPSNYPTEVFGTNLYIHLADKADTRPWLCINQIPPSLTIQKIEVELKNKNIGTEGIHGKTNGTLTSTLILFKVENERAEKKILHTKLTIGNATTTIRKYLNINTLRCTNCQKLGHLNRGCKNVRRCVRCADTNYPQGACLNGNLRRCVNCGKAHSSAYKNCEAIKNNNKNNMEKIKNIQTEQIILNKHNTLLTQQRQHNIEIQEQKRNATTLNKNYEELKAEMTQVKKHMQK